MGILYVVATPIGNLEDITLRALRILKEVDLIACEDSRITKRLLSKYEINTPTISYHQHSSDHKILQIVEKLESGDNIALVTDAGTPGIQDPGGKLVQAAIKKGTTIVPIPGPSAVTTVLSATGIPADQFYFLGFLPKKKGRQTLFKNVAGLKIPLVIYEAPPRVLRTLRDIQEYLGNREVIIGRELTKKFEEIRRDTVIGLIDHFNNKKPKGEFVIIILPDIY